MLLHAYEQYESAEICYGRARILSPDRFQWAYYLGLIQSIDGKNDAAAVTLQEAVRLDPEYLPARMKLAEVLLGLNRLDESRDVCRLAARQDPRFVPAYYWLGRVAAAQGDLNSAIENYRTAGQLAPSFGSAHYALALAYQKLGNPAQAREHMSACQKFKLDGDPNPGCAARCCPVARQHRARPSHEGVDLESRPARRRSPSMKRRCASIQSLPRLTPT